MNWPKLKTFLQNSMPPPEVKIANLTVTWKSMLIVFICALLVVAAAYFKRKTIKDMLGHPSPQETNEKVSKKIQTADQIIFNLFSKLSLDEDAISFRQTALHDGPYAWNYSLITIIVPPGISFSQVENTFSEGFAFFDQEGLSPRFTYDNDACLNVSVTILEHITHHLVFCHDSRTSHSDTESDHHFRVSIVIDDLGENYRAFKELAAMDIPITYSILPFQTHSIKIATDVKNNNGEVILHLPLEPRDSYNHGIDSGTLLTTMDRDQLAVQLKQDMEALPYFSGVSNHMGSKFTEDWEKMETVLKEVKERELYFLDSRTTDKTVAYTLARGMNIKTAQRDLFIDNDHNKLSTEKQLQKIPRLARKNGGSVIAIGHPYPSTIAALKAYIPHLREQGITIVPLSELVN